MQISATFCIDYKCCIVGLIYTRAELSISQIKWKCLLGTNFDKFSHTPLNVIKNQKFPHVEMLYENMTQKQRGSKNAHLFHVAYAQSFPRCDFPRSLQTSKEKLPVHYKSNVNV